MVKLHGIPNCDTVKRARTWLQERGVEVVFHDFKRAGVPVEALARWLSVLGHERLLNRQGTTWRKLDEVTREAVVDVDSTRSLLLAHPSAIRRPVVEWPDGSVSVGFDEAQWAQRFPD